VFCRVAYREKKNSGTYLNNNNNNVFTKKRIIKRVNTKVKRER
jgi:hypothetical protein